MKTALQSVKPVNRAPINIGRSILFTSTTGYSIEGLENCYEAKVGERVISHLAILTEQVDIKKIVLSRYFETLTAQNGALHLLSRKDIRH